MENLPYNGNMPTAGIFKVTDQVLSHPTWDIVLVFALLAAGFFYGISAGKRRIAATILYTYAALTVSLAFPVERWLGYSEALDIFFIRSGAFLAFFLVLAFLLGSRRGRGGFAPASAWWQIFLLSFLQVGLLIHLIVGFLPPEKIKLLAPLTKNVFANPVLHIWWLAVPIIILMLLRRFEAREE